MKASMAKDNKNQNESEHLRDFREKGYTRLPGFFSEEEMDELIHYIRTADPKNPQPSGLNKGELLFYSNLFFKSVPIQKFITQTRIVDFLTGIIGPDFWVRWDQAVFKGPGSAEFPWHQDNAYNRLPVEHFQLWIALSKMNAERGGLWLVPESHKNGLLPHKKIGNHKVFQGTVKDPICLEAEKGDLVLFSSMMLHYTSPNVSTDDRWAYVIEYMSMEHHDPYIDPPFFIAARNGKSSPGFSRFPKARINHLVSALKRRAGRLRVRFS